MYTGDVMKKTEYITFRTNPETKQALEKLAAEKKWTISFLVEEIIGQWLQENVKSEQQEHP